MVGMRRHMRRPRSSSFLQLPLTAGLFLICLHLVPLPVRRHASINDPLSLPWPCLFASASSITHRLASSVSQSTTSSLLITAESASSLSSSSRELQNNNNSNNAQSTAKTDDTVDYTWMAGVNFNDVSIMPVSCVN
jgi:hypothetical protein